MSLYDRQQSGNDIKETAESGSLLEVAFCLDVIYVIRVEEEKYGIRSEY